MRKVIAIACVLLLAACGSMPFSTMWKMRNFSMDDVLALRPQNLRVAVAFDVTTRMSPAENRLTLALIESGKRHEYRFALQNAPGTVAPNPDHFWTVMRLTPASATEFAALQARVRGHSREFAFAEFNWQGGHLDFGHGKPMPALLHLSVDLRLHPNEWLPLFVDYPIRIDSGSAPSGPR